MCTPLSKFFTDFSEKLVDFRVVDDWYAIQHKDVVETLLELYFVPGRTHKNGSTSQENFRKAERSDEPSFNIGIVDFIVIKVREAVQCRHFD